MDAFKPAHFGAPCEERVRLRTLKGVSEAFWSTQDSLNSYEY